MDKEAAVKKVFTEVYVPVFLEKCARSGITFKDQSELDAALETALILKQAQAAGAVPAQATEVSIVKQAAADLKVLLEAAKGPEVSADLSSALSEI